MRENMRAGRAGRTVACIHHNVVQRPKSVIKLLVVVSPSTISKLILSISRVSCDATT